MVLYNYIVLFGTGIIICCFLIALFFRKKAKPDYFKYIFLFILIGILISANTISSNNNAWSLNKKASIFVEQILMTIQIVVLSLFFKSILKKTNYVKHIKYFLFTAILIHFSLLTLVLFKNIEVRPNFIYNLLLLVLCLLYLKDLMNNKPTLILTKSSSFWIVMGIFFTSCVGLPVNSLIPFVPKNNDYINLRFQIFSISNTSMIILYLFIIKSYLCLKHPQIL